MKKNLFEWIAYILLYIWQLPQNIIGVIMWLYFKFSGDVKGISKTQWSSAYSAKSMRGGISLGMYCFLDENLSKKRESVAHELLGHTLQSRILGPLYLLIIGIPSLMNAMFGFTECYYSFYTESWANYNAGLEVTDRCKLKFKD